MIESIFAGPTSKPTFAGYIARAGIEGALLAEAGLAGWHGALEDPRGLISLMGGDPAALLDEVRSLESEWTILDVHQKRYAACRHTHGAAQAAIEIVTGHDLAPHDVARIEVETYDVAKLLVDRQVAIGAGATACTLSLPYVVAAAVADRDVTGAQYASERTSDPEVHRLAAGVTTRVAPDLNARYPAYTATRVTITTTQGASYSACVDLPTGDTRAPMTREQLVEKFRVGATPVLGPDNTERAVTSLLDPTPTTPVRQLVSALTGAMSNEEHA
jgi:2-methylcitrate dehydratase PrpD